MRIELSAKEQQLISAHQRVLAEAERARATLVSICSIIIERGGGDAGKPWIVTADGAALEEVTDGVAE
jgi:hypothetical protein